MVQYLKMKLAGRQFRGFQSAESGTRHGGRPRGQAEAYFFIRTCSDHASSPCPCPPHSFTCQNRVMFRCKPSIGVFLTCACSNAARVQLRFTFFSHHFEIEFRIGLGECRGEREQSSGDNEWWHDEMAHRPSGECGERNLPCDSAVSPITARDQLILLSLLPLSRSRYAFPWPGTLNADALCCMFRG
jgi:hypothetical protein